MAGFHFLSGMPHLFEADIIAKYIILQAELLFEKIFMFFIAFLMTLFRNSIALVVYIIRLIS